MGTHPHIGRRSGRRLAVVGTSAAVLGLTLAILPGGPGERPAAAALTAFDDCADLDAWFTDAALEAVGPYGWTGPYGWAGPASDDSFAVAGNGGAEAMAGSGAERATAGVGPGATGTNVQEIGVDEPDVIKTDGARVVAVWLDRLHVTDVSGAKPVALGSVRLPVPGASELLLLGDRALVLGTRWGDMAHPLGAETSSDTSRPFGLSPGSAVLTVVELSDPGAPRVLHTEEVQGRYLSAREHGGTIRVVVQTQPDLPFVMPDGQRDEDAATEENRRIVRDASPQDWLPQRVARSEDGTGSRTPLLDCADVTHPTDPAGIGVLTVVTLDLDDAAAPMTDRVAVAADGDLVYASTDRLYVATTRGGWGMPRPVDSLAAGALRGSDAGISTELHGFDISGRTATTYLASGQVEGWLLGRWAMSAQDGLLRVATTSGDRWAMGRSGQPDTDSTVTVLAETADGLHVVGSVGGLGKGEQIRAVRWFPDLAVVVTFRQTDPLYTVDLSDPAAPAVLGELKVPGYSGYLHPLGDGLLLGVGQDATDDGRLRGAQVSTFDLRDLAQPARLDNVVMANGWSDVEGDSRQFTYLPEQRLALLPVAGERGSLLWSLRVGAEGALEPEAEWSAPRDEWLARALPVAGERLAVLSDGWSGPRLTVLSVEGLHELGTVPLR
jgi:hypothetical protein